ncbi:hypothetical protein N7509_012265 [Penicillium cosmopolitanum]|uniref:Uncharacterized protein n=1 Tax=Penicillium cosmopolitanum TaxID=1131564 RepID=A0A9W9SIA5_9EURO|nr:uncharacterized protein N7509_012265 [Penicillium cosmopolitanum]KAJ5379146.1 hypothetical protein N7509_012265 [Penicillium cosmopolitanum]
MPLVSDRVPLGEPTVAEIRAQHEWEREEVMAAERAEERCSQHGEEQLDVGQEHQDARERYAVFQDRLRQLREEHRDESPSPDRS